MVCRWRLVCGSACRSHPSLRQKQRTSNFRLFMISIAFSGNPSFINGRIATLLGASAGGMRNTTRSLPSSSFSSLGRCQHRKEHAIQTNRSFYNIWNNSDCLPDQNTGFLARKFFMTFKSKSVREWIPSSSRKPIGKLIECHTLHWHSVPDSGGRGNGSCRAEAQGLVPFNLFSFPVLVPLHLFARLFTKNCISICSNSRMRKMNWRATISFLNALPICAIPKGIFMRPVFWTFKKFTKIPCAVSGRR